MRADRDREPVGEGPPEPIDPHAGLPEDFTPVVPPDRAFDALYGLEMISDGVADGVVRARVAIRDQLRGRSGALHGGVIAAVAEALASRGTWMAVDPGMAVMGLSNDTSFLAPLHDGHLHASATAHHRGASHWLWEVQARDDRDRLCAVTIVNIAVRPFRPPA
ncbi:MAG: PaaI family thioesterase [Solirubrobacteraceae bacterium]